MNIVWMGGIRYKVVHPHVPDPDHWVQMIPHPEKKKKVCDHEWTPFYNHHSGIGEGQRCIKCGKQEWFK